MNSQATTAVADSPVAANGQLEVCGTKLWNEHGIPVQLRGMSTHGTQWYATVPDRRLARTPSPTTGGPTSCALHLCAGGRLRQTDPARFTDLADSLIREASERGLLP
ncbi:glycoside hydrolase family 5 protein [Streptomyces hirsutus]